MFPGATDADKYTENELVGMVEWTLPEVFRTQFDLKGYIPTDHDRPRLIKESEAIERNLKASDLAQTINKTKNNNNNNNKKKV